MQLSENAYNNASLMCDKSHDYELTKQVIPSLFIEKLSLCFTKSLANFLEKFDGLFLRLIG